MSDLFHARVPPGFIRQVFTVMADTPQHTYQVLTKRATTLRLDRRWPPNVWMGVSVEYAESRPGRRAAPVPAAVRFLSCEPLLGPLTAIDLTGIRWVIAGGESGPGPPAGSGWVAVSATSASGQRAVLLQAVGRPHPRRRRPATGRSDLR